MAQLTLNSQIEFKVRIGSKFPFHFLLKTSLVDLTLEDCKYDAVYVGYVPPVCYALSLQIYEKLFRTLKPGGKLLVKELALIKSSDDGQQQQSPLLQMVSLAERKSGLLSKSFINFQEISRQAVGKAEQSTTSLAINEEEKQALLAMDLEVVEYECSSPEYFIGAKVMLPWKKNAQKKTWQTIAGKTAESLENPDDLLSEEDKIPPKRVTGK